MSMNLHFGYELGIINVKKILFISLSKEDFAVEIFEPNVT